MKIKSRNKKINKLILVIAVILLVSLATFLAYVFIFKSLDNKSTGTTQSENTPSDQEQTENQGENPDDKTKAPNTDTPTPPTTTDGSSKKQVQMVASTDQSNDTVFIRGGVNYPVTGGSCYAQLSGPTGQSIRKDSVVLPNPASTDCKTISIPASELTPGKWTFTLNYTSDEYEGVSNEISFTL